MRDCTIKSIDSEFSNLTSYWKSQNIQNTYINLKKLDTTFSNITVEILSIKTRAKNGIIGIAIVK